MNYLMITFCISLLTVSYAPAQEVIVTSTQDLPRGIANNNPLNIRDANYDWLGESVVDTDESFEVFDTSYYGIRAAARILKTYRDKHGLDTITGIVNRWAPAHENPTNSYAAFVSKKANLSIGQKISIEDYPAVIGAMIHFENGYNPYSDSLIEDATVAGFK
tara:strand:- start:298 stop:783 length:486 start_codon:yes stop_codon:yes gene_type:complete